MTNNNCGYASRCFTGWPRNSLNAKVRLFADDTIAYLAIVTDEDARSLQNDPTKLGESEQKWHMEFHPDKCQVLTISRKRNPVRYEYVLHGHKLRHVDSAKYLGVTMTSDSHGTNM